MYMLTYAFPLTYTHTHTHTANVCTIACVLAVYSLVTEGSSSKQTMNMLTYASPITNTYARHNLISSRLPLSLV